MVVLRIWVASSKDILLEVQSERDFFVAVFDAPAAAAGSDFKAFLNARPTRRDPRTKIWPISFNPIRQGLLNTCCHREQCWSSLLFV